MTAALWIKQRLFRASPELVTSTVARLSPATRSRFAIIRCLSSRERGAIDVGANWGVFSSVLAGGSRSVEVFEPHPDKVRYLRSLRLPRCSVHGVALSDFDGEAELIVPESTALATLESAHPLSAESNRTVQRVTVAVRRLDSFGFTGVGLIKIVVEGHELAVLTGAAETIDRERPFLVVKAEKRYNVDSFDELFAFMSGQGYRRFSIHGRSVADIRFFDVERDQTAAISNGIVDQARYRNNFLFLPDEEVSAAIDRMCASGFIVAA